MCFIVIKISLIWEYPPICKLGSPRRTNFSTVLQSKRVAAESLSSQLLIRKRAINICCFVSPVNRVDETRVFYPKGLSMLYFFIRDLWISALH